MGGGGGVNLVGMAYWKQLDICSDVLAVTLYHKCN